MLEVLSRVLGVRGMKKRANVLKKAAALLAVFVGGVVFCCTRKDVGVSDDPMRIVEVPLEPEIVLDEPVTSAGPDPGPAADEAAETESASESGIWVYVCGAVRSPGVYYVDSDARVFEAVDLAGGFSADAREDAVNLAETMTDGERILVPDVSMENADAEALSLQADVPGSAGKVNINRADVSELMTLPGIGESKARAIVAYRQEHPFQSIDEIMNVSGIKEGSFEKIRDLITI